VAEVPQLIGKVKTEEEFLERSAQLLADRTKLEYVAIFLVNQVAENAFLHASNNEIGKSLISKGFQLRVVRSESSLAILGGEVLHFQVGKVNYIIDRPDPIGDTKINISLPLISGEHLLGLINIQSTAHDQEIIDQQALQTFADQVSLSIENLRLLDQLQSRIREVSLLAGQTVQSSWEKLQRGKAIGYHYDQVRVMPIDESLPVQITKQLSSGKPITYISSDNPAHARLIVPIILRENVIGIIGYEDNDINHEWQESEMTLLEAIASRVSLALENTRLVAEAQQRAERERTLSQITARMRETLDIDSVLKTAVQEIKSAFNLEQAEVRLQLANQKKKTGQ
jgi:GAF domain-containing protein